MKCPNTGVPIAFCTCSHPHDLPPGAVPVAQVPAEEREESVSSNGDRPAAPTSKESA